MGTGSDRVCQTQGYGNTCSGKSVLSAKLVCGVCGSFYGSKVRRSTAQSQDAYLQKYEALTKRYEAAAAELERLKGIRAERERQDQAMALFIRTLKKQPEVLDAWSDTIWTVMVERVLVHKDGGLTFRLYNGSEIRIGA